jgi:hypothetical protein
MIRHPKRRGEWVELQFMARAANHGLTISKPWGDARYDFIVEARGVFRRVQVKSTTFRPRQASYMCNTRSRPTGRSRNGKLYKKCEIDFLAFYVVPEDVWYIVPMAEFHNANAYLDPHNPRNRYFPFMEAWHLLKRGSLPKESHSRNSARIKVHACAEPMASLPPPDTTR